MLHSSHPHRALGRTLTIKRALRAFFVMACVNLMVGAGHAFAQDGPAAFPEPRYVPPETMLISMRPNAQSGTSSGWQLLYRNGLHGPEARNVVMETRTVTLEFKDGRTLTGEITWKIVRTGNNTCAGATTPACPDRFQVLSVPEGFMAVPAAAWVDEGRGLRVFVVPVGIG